jgi:inosose dehydratase
MMNRRGFLKSGLGSTTALAAVTMGSRVLGAVTKPQRDPMHELKLGVASYSLRNFSLELALTMTKQLKVKYITLKDMHLPFKTTTAERKAAAKKVAAAGLTLMGGGVVYMNNKEDEVRSYFEYAKDAGMPTIVSSPEPAALDLVEKVAKEYDIRVAIHNHGPGDTRYPSPLDVLRLVKDRDEHMGVCIDVGHTVRIGQDPIEAIEQCASRLYDFHIKDVTQATREGGATEVGRGVIDIPAILKTLVRLKWPYHLALEYETNGDAPMQGMVESFAYMRGVLATLD